MRNVDGDTTFGVKLVGLLSWPATPAAYRWDLVDQRHQSERQVQPPVTATCWSYGIGSEQSQSVDEVFDVSGDPAQQFQRAQSVAG